MTYDPASDLPCIALLDGSESTKEMVIISMDSGPVGGSDSTDSE